MGKLATKVSRQIMAAILTVAMIMSNMTVYASELNAPQTQSGIDVGTDSVDGDVTEDVGYTDDETDAEEPSEIQEDETVYEDESSTDDVEDEIMGDSDASDEAGENITASDDETGAADDLEDQTVSEASESAAKVYELVNNEITKEITKDLKVNDKGDIQNGTILGTDVYFKLVINDKSGYVRDEGKDYFRVSQEARAGIEFTVKGTANVVVSAASTGGGNTSWVALLDKSTNENVTEKDGKISVTDAAVSKLTYENVPEGTYMVITPKGPNNNRDVRIHSITVTETSDRSERADFSSLTKPEVVSATVNQDATLTVAVKNAKVGYDGGDRLIVFLEDGDGNKVSERVSAIEGDTHEVTLDISTCKTGTYTVKAKLVRGTGTSAQELIGEVTQTFSYAQDLQDPTSLYITNKGKVEGAESGSVWLTWRAALGAEYYVVKVIDESGSESSVKTEGSRTDVLIATGLTIGNKYTFKVYAARMSGGEEELSAKPCVEENYEIIEGEGDAPHAKGNYILQISKDVELFGENTKLDGEMQKAGDDKFFTLIYTATSKVEESKKTFEDKDGNKKEETGKLSLNGVARTDRAAIRFTTTAASKVTVYWQVAGDGRGMCLLDSTGEEVTSTNIDTKKDALYISQLYLDYAGTYYLGGKGGNNFIFRVEVDNGYTRERPDWDSVAAPEMKVAQDGADIKITVKARIDAEGENAEADKVEVTMYDEDGKVAGSAKTTSKSINPVLVITPAASGNYRFKAELSRNDDPENVKSAYYPVEEGEYFSYTLPLSIPELDDVKNLGSVDDAKKYGAVELTWKSVKEADRYIVNVKGKDVNYEKEYTVDSPTIIIDKDLEVGKTYTFSVCAQRDVTGTTGEDGKLIPETTDKASIEVKIEADYKSNWNFVVYGIGTSPSASGYVAADGTKASDSTIAKFSSGYVLTEPDGTTTRENITPTVDDLGDDDFVRMWTWNGKGKIVPADTDGLAFYYTTINPNTTNFKLSANLHVNHWQIGNGQEGFGLLAADWIGENGDTSYHWTNSYTAVVSKVDYRWDSVNGKVSKSGDVGVTLRLGIGSTAKTGVTAENLPLFENDVTTATTQYYNTETLPLDTSVHTDIYDNLIGNENLGSTVSVPNPITDLKLSIELNATGYFVSYTPLTRKADGSFDEGETVTNKYYDRNALSMCEDNTAYIGFFATRYADVTFSNVKLDTRPYDPNEETENKPVEEVELKASVSGASTANSADYILGYSANWKGTVTIRDEAGAVLEQADIEPKKGDLEELGSTSVKVKLHVGTNKFQATFTPDRDYDPYDSNPYARLTSYDSKVDTITVTWKKYGKEGEVLYVAPNGKATGDGTKLNPLDIYTAVKYVQPGQTIYLMGGTYNLTKTIKIDRGINGTEDKKIYMLADPETCTKENGVRPVFDFNSQCAGMEIAGDWWYYQGFDVTRSANQTKGIHVSGSHNVLDGLGIYKNGSTGLQISRFYSSDKTIDEWPSYNLILNCTACLNADAGYTDADGFAAKLTVGVGNVFDGCVSAYNADDGWDLFAKVWTGPIGVVTIQNCVSFENGQVIRDKKTHELVWFNESDDYEIVDAGSGNGFKMGGSSITGYHTLINSVAFHNKSKGFDCNSCPDIQLYNSITYDNKSYNIAMYSNASTTDFGAYGVISYRSKVGKDVEDRIGTTQSPITETQENCVDKIFNGKSFFWNKLSYVSEPSSEFYKHYTTWPDKKTQPPVPSVTVSDDWFVDLDYDTWVTTYCPTMLSASRDADGKVNLHGYLELTPKGKAAMAAAGADGEVGLGEGQVSQDADSFIEDGIISGTETNGNIDVGNAAGEKDDSMDYGDFAQMPGKADEVGLWFAIVDRDQIEYTGKAVKPEVHVYSGMNLLKKGKDYTVTYKNNVNAYVGAYDDSYYSKNSENYVYDGVTFEELKASYGSVNDNKKPTIIIKAKGNYKNVANNVTQVYFDINPVSLTDDAMNRITTNDIALISKSGNPLQVNPTVTFNNKKLSSSNNKDYSFEVYNTDESGNLTGNPLGTTVSAVDSYKVKITGKNNFSGITTVNLAVVDGSDKNILASNFKLGHKIPDQYREGYNLVSVDEEIPLPVTLSTTGDNPDLVVKDKDGNTLVQGENYELSYKNNIDIGTATVIVTGLSHTDENGKTTVYVGSKEFKFRIVAPTLNKMLKDKEARFIDTTSLSYKKAEDGMLKIDTPENEMRAFGDNHSYQYEGKAVDPVNDELTDKDGNVQKLGLAVKRGDSWYLLVQDKDYKLTYRNNTRQGNATAVFKGIGNYRGSVTQKFKVTPFDLDDVKNRLPQEGEAVSRIGGTFEIKAAKSGEGDTVTYTGEVFKDGYNTSTKTYTGMQAAYEKGGVKPTVSLRINGNLLKAGKDYTITYRNNTKITDSTTANKMPAIIIKGKNGLKGTLTGTFTISKKSLNDPENRITVTAQDIKISKKTSDGYKGNYKTRVVVKDAKGKTLSAGADYNKNIKYELVDNNSYEVIKALGNKDQVTIKNNDPDQYLTVKVTVYPNSNSRFYEGSEEGISAYYRVLYAKNSIRSAKFEVHYSVANTDETCLYEADKNNKYFYYYEDGINLNRDMLTVKLGDQELTWGEDFEVVKYVGNNKIGTAKLTIQGKGKYFDTKVITFKIMPKEFKWWQK